MSFEEYGLNPELLSGLADVRIEKPTSLQHEVLSAALQGKHMLVKTEAEEEGAFLIPALQKIAENGEVTGTQVLILTPSIERAKKIDELVWAMGYHAQISSALLSMKGNKSEQEEAVLDGAPVVVANPGRLVDILEKNNFQLPNLKFLVIDEAHEMENFNLVNRVKDILRFVDGEPQALILSNHDNKATKQLAEAALKNPELIGFKAEELAEGENKELEESAPKEIDLKQAEEKLNSASVKVVLKKDIVEDSAPEVETEDKVETADTEESTEDTEEEAVEGAEDAKAELTEEELKAAEEKLQKASVTVVLKKDIEVEEKSQEEEKPKAASQKKSIPVDGFEQGYINVPTRMKISILMSHLEEYSEDRVILFAASKRTIDRLFRIIRKKSWGVASVSDTLDEETYQERFARFTSGEMRILLVGGIAADKVKIEDVDQIINYDVPSEVEEYSYRAELVGKGKVKRIVSLVSGMDKEDIDRITNEAGFAPVELPLPKEVIEKKEKKVKAAPKPKVEVKKKPAPKKSKKASTNNRKGPVNKQSKPKSSNRNGNRNQNNKSSGRGAKGKKTGLPRPTYDGLSGGRDGNKSSGVFGWVKKLFD